MHTITFVLGIKWNLAHGASRKHVYILLRKSPSKIVSDEIRQKIRFDSARTFTPPPKSKSAKLPKSITYTHIDFIKSIDAVVLLIQIGILHEFEVNSSFLKRSLKQYENLPGLKPCPKYHLNYGIARSWPFSNRFRSCVFYLEFHIREGLESSRLLEFVPPSQ